MTDERPVATRHTMTIRVKRETPAGEWVEVSSEFVERDHRPSDIFSLGSWPACHCPRHRGREPESHTLP